MSYITETFAMPYRWKIEGEAGAVLADIIREIQAFTYKRRVSRLNQSPTLMRFYFPRSYRVLESPRLFTTTPVRISMPTPNCVNFAVMAPAMAYLLLALATTQQAWADVIVDELARLDFDRFMAAVDYAEEAIPALKPFKLGKPWLRHSDHMPVRLPEEHLTAAWREGMSLVAPNSTV